ncbi:hypothetical protein RJ639_015432 [Escallonia herrerae]|uniref:Protein kinase domain-containing protein n=1 Tax=Escallonia herrerae TaxID=1293975 RepID=A0AA88VJB4_9ASTE|nr:hypothetical protein RJ639_015432 [Escallonia herrerae]
MTPGKEAQESTTFDRKTMSGSLNNALVATKIGNSNNLKSFSFNDLKNATKNFRPDSLLGEGGFGWVFKGWIDQNTFSPSRPGTGIVIAVKKLKTESIQGHREWLEFNAKLSDFGLARAGPTGDNTHVSTRVVGTQGYAAPEYVATGHLTPKSDVYSYGVVLLELLSGKRTIGDERAGGVDETLVDWAKPFLADSRKVLRIMDTRLGGQYSKKDAQALAALALQCLHTDPKNRPAMIDVLATLEQLHTSKDLPRIPPQTMLERREVEKLGYARKMTFAPANSR